MPRGSRRRRRRLAAASGALLRACLAAVLLAAAVAAVAHAQSNPGEIDPYGAAEQASGATGLDTDQTPAGKPTGILELVAGAAWDEDENDPGTGVVFGSATSFDDNLYTVGFSEREEEGGFAGGATCQEPAPGNESDCRPVLYQHGELDVTQGPQWRKVALPGASAPGYIGAIAWIGTSGKALAVGGSGTYPRRDPAYRRQCQSFADDAPEGIGRLLGPYGSLCDEAGEARAWLYDGAAWRELSDDEIPDGMRGLSALGFDPLPGRELGFAGALGQLWKWESGRFTGAHVDAESPAAELQNAHRFRFRVRDIEFVRGEPQPTAYAVTAGCCSESRLTNTPAVLTYAGKGTNPVKWRAFRPLRDPREDIAGTGQAFGAGAATDPSADPSDAANLHQERPDSLYSVMVRRGNGTFSPYKFSALATAGGSESAAEPPSTLTPRYCTDPVEGFFHTTSTFPLTDALELTRANLSTARLVAGDGDSALPNTFFPQQTQDIKGGSPATMSPPLECGNDESTNRLGRPAPDSVPDWVVGEWRSASREGLGSRGLLVANPLRPDFNNDAFDPPVFHDPQGTEVPLLSGAYGSVPTSDVLDGSYEPTSDERLREWARSQYYLLPSYGLNAIDVASDAAAGWAVGDHGAILSLTAEAAGAAPEPAPPRLGAARQSSLADSSAYEGSRPGTTGQPSPVPGLSARPLRSLPEPRLIAAGSPDPSGAGVDPIDGRGTSVRELAISRDGTAGWAVGPTTTSRGAGSPTTLYRLAHGQWSACDLLGVEGQLPPDPDCAGIADIRNFTDPGGVVRSVKLRAIARIPLESDSDPTNDDEFEAVAVGSRYLEGPGKPFRPAVLRFADGRWSFEPSEAREAITEAAAGESAVQSVESGLADVAFTAPDDGWILTMNDKLFHFDGERWASCSAEADACFDPDRRTEGIAINSDGARIESGLVAAGDRTYLFGERAGCPAIVYHQRGAESWRGSADGADGGYDPGFGGAGCAGESSTVESVAVGQRLDGAFEGWAVLRVTTGSPFANQGDGTLRMMRLTPGGAWQVFSSDDALTDYIPEEGSTRAALTAMVPRADGGLDAFIAQEGTGRLFRHDPDSQSWELVPAERPAGEGDIAAIAPGGNGALWVATSANAETPRGESYQQPYFFRHSDRAPEEVFTEAPNPTGGEAFITAATPGPDGSLWLATSSDAVYRYDRVLGWEQLRISGWDPGRVVTRTSQARSIAFNASGEGLIVGEDGRIADLTVETARLDRAAGVLCDGSSPEGPCGTGRDLVSAAVAPDGSAIAGGEGGALLWRPAGGEFRAVAHPDLGGATIAGVTMPAPGRAWFATTNGLVFGGRMEAPGQWSWQIENLDDRGDPLTLDPYGERLPLRAVAIDDAGNGLAVGDNGVVLERREGDDRPWRRLDVPYLDSFTSVTLAPGGGGALIGARQGAILTYADGTLDVARAAEWPGNFNSLTDDSFTRKRPVVGLALLPGVSPGQTEAWAAIQGSHAGDSALLHYASDPAEPLLQPVDRATPLADAPPPRDGELAIAAFGNTRCLTGSCEEMSGSIEDYEVYTERIVDELGARSGTAGGADLAVFTGDLTDNTGTPPSSSDRGGRLKPRRWLELVAEPLEESGVPLLGAIGRGDLSGAPGCEFGQCGELRGGENLAWRDAMASRPAPWGSGPPGSAPGIALEPVPDGAVSTRPDASGVERIETPDPDGTGPATSLEVPVGGASTHYAVDVVRGGERAARLVFVDTSLGSLASSDPVQNPVEPAGGQSAWLEEMLCTSGGSTAAGAPCTREPGQKAIVVSNAPSYSYGPGQQDVQADAAAFEATLMRHDADLVLSGRIGWNARYWATAPGVHYPCPGGEHPADGEVPAAGSRDCGGTIGGNSGLPQGPAAAGLEGSGVLPFVIASGAGRFAADGSDDASDGFWHGYTMVRVPASGDPRELIVEQRPVLDWLSLGARERQISPRARLTLVGEGREPIGTPGGLGDFTVRYDSIDSAAITHRYDLLLADPDEPWLPCREGDPGCESLAANLAARTAAEGEPAETSEPNGCAPYLCLPDRVGTVDRTTGELRAGDGRYPQTFGLAMLSVGAKSATYPLVFERSPSFVVKSALRTLGAPVPHKGAGATAPPPPPTPDVPKVPEIKLPAVPVPPAIPLLAAASPPEPQAPVPPAPPPPAQQPAPLDLSVAPPGVSLTPPTALIQPPTPPVNPAPPGGARREARQRQAAAQKSGADAESSETQELGGDLAQGDQSPHGSAEMTRRDAPFARRSRSRPEPSFSAYRPAADSSPLGPGALYASGLTLLAFALAAGWSRGRPTPRRREPELPAPAWSTNRRWGD